MAKDFTSDVDYYNTKMLSVSSVRLFQQNPARALADWSSKHSWFENDSALLYGRYVHAAMQDFMTEGETHFQDTIRGELKRKSDDPKDDHKIFKKNGDYYAEYATMDKAIDVLQKCKIISFFHSHLGDERFDPVVEAGLIGTLHKDGEKDLKVKGKPDLLMIDKEKKQIYAFDYKTSKTYDPSGMGYAVDINTLQRGWINLAWSVQKAFPWQAGVYRELIRQSGAYYADYPISYRYLVVTKEKVPRLDIWTISNEAMDQGYAAFKKAAFKARKYINGEAEAELRQDDSNFFNLSTQFAGNLLGVDRDIIEEEDASDGYDFIEHLGHNNEGLII